MDFAGIVFDIVLGLVVIGIIFRKRLRAWLSGKIQSRKTAAQAPAGLLEPADLTTRLYELEKIFGPFGNGAAHPSALYAKPEFAEAVGLLAAPKLPIAVVLQYVEGNMWALSSAALAALLKRPDRGAAIERVLRSCQYYSPWAMYFALELLVATPPRAAVGAPFGFVRDWWLDNRWMLNILRDYLAGCTARAEAITFGTSLAAPNTSPHDLIRRFLQRIDHPAAATLIEELDTTAPVTPPKVPTANLTTLRAVGRFWDDDDSQLLVEPHSWGMPFSAAKATLGQYRTRSLLVCGERSVGKTSFLRLLRRQIGDWTVFEASGADLQAGQIYIGQLEGRLREVVDELGKADKLIWYIPDIVQLAMSGRHQGQSATMLDQIVPAIAAGRLVVWAEATPRSAARLMQIKPSLRGLFETVTLDALAPAETLTLARELIERFNESGDRSFAPQCAEVALDSASHYLGSSGLPGSALLMLRLAAARAEGEGEEHIAPRRVLETLAQLSGLPLSILDNEEQLDLGSIRDFFNSRVLGQDEAVAAMVERIAMLKAGLNDPNKPIGVFLFAGPTGTGKTELAKAVSEFLFGSVERMIRLDMSEFQSLDAVNKILGERGSSWATAAETDSLISRVRKQPFSVLLLDEFEKSHPMIWDLFLQAFDEGRLTDAMGEAADLRHCLIILTSNLGATAHRSLGLGFAPQADVFTQDQVMLAISQTYRPEFRNRLDKVIVFRPLTRELMRGILKKELAALLDRRGLKDRAWAIEWESSALEFLLEKGFSPEMGARPLKRAIDQYVVAPLAGIIVEQRFPEGEQFLFVRSDGAGIQAEFVDPDADVTAAHAAPPVSPGEAASPAALASIILAPQGNPAEFQVMQAEYDGIERTLRSADWTELKDKLTGEMAAANFWSRPDRFGTLARFALMDRVKAAAETADALRQRVARYGRSPRRYSAELGGRLALQLHLIKQGIKDAIEAAPVEIALVTEPVLDGAGDRQATRDWCRRLDAMYRGWAGKRRMNIGEAAGEGADKDAPVLLISGFGVHRVLAPEAGLHVLEPFEGASGRVTARVRIAVVPLGDVPAAKERRVIAKALDEAPRATAVVRRYREDPPLVRDAAGKWRSGRLDLVLGGEFDLLQAGLRPD